MNRVLIGMSWLLLLATVVGYVAQVLRDKADSSVGGLIFLMAFAMVRLEELSRRKS